MPTRHIPARMTEHGWLVPTVSLTEERISSITSGEKTKDDSLLQRLAPIGALPVPNPLPPAVPVDPDRDNQPLFREPAKPMDDETRFILGGPNGHMAIFVPSRALWFALGAGTILVFRFFHFL